MKGSYLGPDFTDDEIEAFLNSTGAVYHRFERSTLLETVAIMLGSEKIVGWFNGRMGVRAPFARVA